MKKTDFAKQTDTIIQNWPREKMAAFIRKLAAGLDEEQQDAFLSELQSVSRVPAEKPADEDKLKNLHKKAADMMKELEFLQTSACLESSFEFGDDGYDEDEWGRYDEEAEARYEFTDPAGILNAVKRACRLTHFLADGGLYADAYNLCVCLTEMQIEVSGDYAEDSIDPVIDLAELSAYTEGIPLRHLLLDGAYSAYCLFTDPDDKAYAVYDCMKKGRIRLHDLEKRTGAELQSTDPVLRPLAKLLTGESGSFANNLFTDVLVRIGDPFFVESMAELSAQKRRQCTE